MQDRAVEVLELNDTAAVDQVTEELAQVSRDVQVLDRRQRVSRGLEQRINVNAKIIFEQAPEGLENAAFQVRVVFFVEQLEQAARAHRDADTLVRVSAQVRGQPVVLKIVGNKHYFSGRSHHVRAR